MKLRWGGLFSGVLNVYHVIGTMHSEGKEVAFCQGLPLTGVPIIIMCMHKNFSATFCCFLHLQANDSVMHMQ